MEIITTRDELIALAARLRVRPDWHEPDEQGVDATVDGHALDNAGFWPTDSVREWNPDLSSESIELHVTLRQDGKAIAAVNLATLLSWACGHDDAS